MEETSESRKQAAFDRQADDYDRNRAVGIFCPWCTKMNTPEITLCCALFSEAMDHRGIQKLQNVIEQHRRMESEGATSIECPWCFAINGADTDDETNPQEWMRPGISPFCCDLFGRAVEAIAGRMALQHDIDLKNRIEDNLSKARRN